MKKDKRVTLHLVADTSGLEVYDPLKSAGCTPRTFSACQSFSSFFPCHTSFPFKKAP